jgi:hypothetical protein
VHGRDRAGRGARVNFGFQGDVSCWLTGDGAYDGLTYHQHISAASLGGVVEGVILPVAAPVAARTQ